MGGVVEFEQGRYPSQKDLVGLVDAVRSWRDKTFIILAAQSGVRRSMACALKVNNVGGYRSGWVLRRPLPLPCQVKRHVKVFSSLYRFWYNLKKFK